MREVLITLLLLSTLGCASPAPVREPLTSKQPIPVSILPSDGEQVMDKGWIYSMPYRWPLKYCTIEDQGWLGIPDYTKDCWDWKFTTTRVWEHNNFLWDGFHSLGKTSLARWGDQTPATAWYVAPTNYIYATAEGDLTPGGAVEITFRANDLSGIDFYAWFVFDGPATPTSHPSYPNLYYVPKDNVFTAAGQDPYWGEKSIQGLLKIELYYNERGVTWEDSGFDYLRYKNIDPGRPMALWSVGVSTGGKTPIVNGTGALCTRVFMFPQPGDYILWFSNTDPHEPRTYLEYGGWKELMGGTPLLIHIE